MWFKKEKDKKEHICEDFDFEKKEVHRHIKGNLYEFLEFTTHTCLHCGAEKKNIGFLGCYVKFNGEYYNIPVEDVAKALLKLK